MHPCNHEVTLSPPASGCSQSIPRTCCHAPSTPSVGRSSYSTQELVNFDVPLAGSLQSAAASSPELKPLHRT